jgi:hypothetical protein
LQLCADNIRHLKFDDDDFMHHGLFNQCWRSASFGDRITYWTLKSLEWHIIPFAARTRSWNSCVVRFSAQQQVCIIGFCRTYCCG